MKSELHTFVVVTRYLENYGTCHSDFRWKSKGGQPWIVSHCHSELDALAAVSTVICRSGSSLGSVEFVHEVMPLREWDPSSDGQQRWSYDHVKFINCVSHFEMWCSHVCHCGREMVCKPCDDAREAESNGLCTECGGEKPT